MVGFRNSEPIMDANTAKLIRDAGQGLSSGIAKVWPVVGLLAGILFGASLTGRSQRRKWLADNQKEEYRELLTALVTSFDEIGTNIVTWGDWTEDERKAEVERVRRSLNVIADRIYIANDMRDSNLFNRWKDAIVQFRKDKNYLVFEKIYFSVRDELVERARKVRV
jgi:hypothetical protein